MYSAVRLDSSGNIISNFSVFITLSFLNGVNTCGNRIFEFIINIDSNKINVFIVLKSDYINILLLSNIYMEGICFNNYFLYVTECLSRTALALFLSLALFEDSANSMMDGSIFLLRESVFISSIARVIDSKLSLLSL